MKRMRTNEMCYLPSMIAVAKQYSGSNVASADWVLKRACTGRPTGKLTPRRQTQAYAFEDTTTTRSGYGCITQVHLNTFIYCI